LTSGESWNSVIVVIKFGSGGCWTILGGILFVQVLRR
jgi:hypothetical protein